VFVQPTPHGVALAFLRAVLNSPGVEMPPLGREWPLLERLREHQSPDRKRYFRCLDCRCRPGPARSPGEFRQGIPPFPEAEGIHFAAALSSHVHGILCGRHTVTDRPRGLVGVGGSKPDFDVGPGDAINAY
jgi:hypothetical protein